MRTPQSRDESTIESLFPQALRLPEGDRSAFLDRQNLAPSVRRELDELIDAASRAADSFLRHDAWGDPLTLSEDEAELELRAETLGSNEGEPAEQDPDARVQIGRAQSQEEIETGGRLGAYRLLRALGEGGMGKVYLAARADREYDKQVAIKLARPAVASAERRRRLRAERQILASLEHPHIARLLDGGTTPQGRPYLVMEYVEGEPIDAFCARHGLSIEERIALVHSVCRAVHYAHQNRVVHKDLKPSNILVTADGTPKLVDFGIAELLDPPAGATPSCHAGAPGQMTIDYASPEQIAGEPVSAASDVYSLGVVLYELLTGLPPFDSRPGWPDEDALRRTAPLASERLPPTSPASLRRRLRGDLDRILEVALAPRPVDRYPSAHALGDDLERHLERRPVRARGEAWTYRAATLVRRRPGAVASVVVVLALLVAGTIALAVLAARVAEERDAARRERDAKAEVLAFVEGLLAAADPWDADWQDASVQTMLERGAVDAEAFEAAPAVRSDLFDLLARLHASWGQTERAEALARAGLALRLAQDDTDPSALAESWQGLGLVLWYRGEDAEAEAAIREALALRRAAGDTPEEEIAESLASLGVVLRDMARHEEAERVGEQALAIRRRVLGDTHPKTLESLGDRVGALHYKGELEAAEALSLEVIELRTETYSPGHPLLGLALHNHAFLLRTQERFAEAEPFARRAVATLLESLGTTHPDVAMAQKQLALLLTRQGRSLDEAAGLYREALRATEELGEAATVSAAEAWFGLAEVELARSRPEAAEDAASRALSILQPLVPENHPRLLVVKSLLGEILLRRGRATDAGELLEAAYSGLVASYGISASPVTVAADGPDASLSPGSVSHPENPWVRLARRRLTEWACGPGPPRRPARCTELRAGTTGG